MNGTATAIGIEGRAISARYRIYLSASLLLSGWLLAALSNPLVVAGTRSNAILDGIGWACFGAGIAIRYWAICHIAGRKTRTIVDSGPYAVCRNPLYVGTLLIVTAEAAFLKSGWFAVALFALMLFYATVVVPSEERKLCARLGPAFAEYCARVPRWRLQLDRSCLQSALVVDRTAIHSELRCLVCWAMLPIIGQLTCYLRVHPGWPHFFPGF